MKFPKFIYLLCLLLLSNFFYGQKYSATQIDSMLEVSTFLVNTNPEKAITHSKMLYKYCVDANDSYGQTESLLHISHSYSYLKQFEKAIEAASKAESAAIKFDDNYSLTDALRIKALAYSSLGYHSNAKEINQKGIDITYKIKDINFSYSQRGLLYESLATIMHNENKSLDSIIYYDRKSIACYLNVKDGDGPFLLTSGYTNLASDFLDLKKLDSSEFYFRKALNLAESLDKDYDKIQILCDLGVIFQTRNNHPEAIKYFKDAIIAGKKFKDPYALRNIYKHISKSYEALNDYKNANINIKLHTTLNDSLLNIEKKSLITPMNQIIKDKETDFNESSEYLYRIILASTLFTLVCIYIGVLFYRKFKNERLTSRQTELLLKEKMLQISNSPKIDETKLNSTDLEEVIGLAINDEPSFFIKFEEVFPNFKSKLTAIAPSIVASELKFSAYIRLDFSTKEIARYTNSSVRAIEGKKYRLRKKLGIASDEDTNIWMSKI